MKDRIKKYAKENPLETAYLAGVATACVVFFFEVKLIKSYGYKMLRPVGYSADGFPTLKEFGGQLYEFHRKA